MRRWRIDAAPASAEMGAIAGELAGGGIVLLPTDTIYGLHALAADEDAVQKLATAKGRDDLKPFVVIAAGEAQLEQIGIDIGPDVRPILRSLWPAPLTAILPLSHPVAASRGAPSLAVRIPDLEWLRELLKLTGPLASTSANRSGEPPISSPDQLAAEVESRLAGIVDRGLFSGEPSTIVDFTGDEPRFIREGGLTFSQKVRKTLRKKL